MPRASSTRRGSFFFSGNTATVMGARRGCRCRTVRVNSSPSLSETPRTFLKTSMRFASASSDSPSRRGGELGGCLAEAALRGGVQVVALLDRLAEALHQLAQLGHVLGRRLLDQGILVGFTQERQRGPIGARRRLDHVRDDVLLVFLVEVAQLLDRVGVAGPAVVRLQFVVGAVRDAFQLAPAHGEAVLEIDAALGVMGQLVLLLLALAQVLLAHAEVQVPPRARAAPGP